MLFGKEKMSYGAYCCYLFLEIFQIEDSNYDQYLATDDERILSETEFNQFNDQIFDFRIILGLSGLFEKKDQGKIKLPEHEAMRIASQAIGTCLRHEKYDEEYITNKLDYYYDYFYEFIDYVINNDSSDNDDAFFHAAMFFSKKFPTPTNLKKNSIYAAITNNNRRLVKDLFNRTFNNVKLTY